MKLRYKLKRDVVARVAAILCQDLSLLSSSIYIQGNNKTIDGKSIIGVLSGQYRMGDVITIIYDKEEDLDKIKEIFNELGGEY